MARQPRLPVAVTLVSIALLAAGLLGMAVLCCLGLATIRGRHELAGQAIDAAPGAASARRAFKAGALLSLANPLDFVFWLSLGSRALSDPAVDALAYLGAFLVGLVAASVLVAIVAGLWPSRLPARAAVAVSWLCGLAFIGFGLQLGLSAGRQLTTW
ncbi:MAG: LysE family transporter [Anaerolineales bacterium]|nr:LysE family transporter [Anaerolineales bacterium]